jgi:hypothetical protein
LASLRLFRQFEEMPPPSRIAELLFSRQFRNVVV